MDDAIAEKVEALKSRVKGLLASADPAHDFSHIMRVYRMADRLCKEEGGDPAIALPAALLHDLYQVPKDHPDRAKASGISAQMAEKLLRDVAYPEEKIPAIIDAIRAHSFSRGEKARSKEAMIIQDADRLDAIGAIGIARLWATSGKLNRPFYHPDDPFFESDRQLDENKYGLDHAFQKLLKLKDMMNTPTARKIAEGRHAVLVNFLEEMRKEIS